MRAAVLEVPLVDNEVVNVVEVLFFGLDTDHHVLKRFDAFHNGLLFCRVVYS